jgi:hypothetical protein
MMVVALALLLLARGGLGDGVPACTAPAPSPILASARSRVAGPCRGKGPSCGPDGLPRMLPPWPPTYNLSLSTTMYAENSTGPWDVTLTRDVGLVIMPIQNDHPGHPAYPGSHQEQKAEASCRQQKQLNPASRCTVYYNTELGMEWDDSQKELMTVENSDLWLQYQTQAACDAAGDCTHVQNRAEGNAGCCAFGRVYSEPIGPGANQTFWNYSNPRAVDTWIHHSVLGSHAGGSPYVDGISLDDPGGIGNEHACAPGRMGITPTDCFCCQDLTHMQPGIPCCAEAQCSTLEALQNDTKNTFKRVTDLLQQAGKWNTDNLLGTEPTTHASCATFVRSFCESGLYLDQPWQHAPHLCNPKDPNRTIADCSTDPLWGQPDMPQQVATLLLGRGNHAWLGYGWVGSIQRSCKPNESHCRTYGAWDRKLMSTDVGEPRGNCSETSSGVFARKWSKGTVELDCNSWTAKIPGYS